MWTLPQNPIFIVGPPRSGTTYLQSLLACQDGVYSFPETHFFSAMRWLGLGRELRAEMSDDERDTLITEVCRRSGMEPCADTQFVDATPKGVFEGIVRQLLLSRPEVPSGDNWRWAEKTPGHVFHLDVIAELYPDAKFLGIFRAPVDSVLSRKMKIPADQSKSVRRLTLSWIQAVKAMNRFAKQNPERMRLIPFEKLTEKSDETMADACDFLGVTFRSENCARVDQEKERVSRSHEVWKESRSSGVKSKGLVSYARIFMWTLGIRITLWLAALRGDLKNGAIADGA